MVRTLPAYFTVWVHAHHSHCIVLACIIQLLSVEKLSKCTVHIMFIIRQQSLQDEHGGALRS